MQKGQIFYVNIWLCTPSGTYKPVWESSSWSVSYESSQGKHIPGCFPCEIVSAMNIALEGCIWIPVLSSGILKRCRRIQDVITRTDTWCRSVVHGHMPSRMVYFWMMFSRSNYGGALRQIHAVYAEQVIRSQSRADWSSGRVCLSSLRSMYHSLTNSDVWSRKTLRFCICIESQDDLPSLHLFSSSNDWQKMHTTADFDKS